jgi:hypothetical protein
MPPAHTPPNATFIDDPAVVSDKRLDSIQLSFFEGDAVRLTFGHNFNLEASDVDPNLGFDGGVLELSTDGGNTFQDILAAGGSFVLGGYNRTISTDRGSPIAGRQAWSGNSGGFITTVVNVPAFQSLVRLRWRMASDSSGSSEGWRVDSVYITWCHGFGPPCTPTPSPPPSCEIIQNNGFESGSFAPWVIQDTNLMPIISTAQQYSGIYSAHIGSFRKRNSRRLLFLSNDNSACRWRDSLLLVLAAHNRQHRFRLAGRLCDRYVRQRSGDHPAHVYEHPRLDHYRFRHDAIRGNDGAHQVLGA